MTAFAISFLVCSWLDVMFYQNFVRTKIENVEEVGSRTQICPMNRMKSKHDYFRHMEIVFVSEWKVGWNLLVQTDQELLMRMAIWTMFDSTGCCWMLVICCYYYYYFILTHGYQIIFLSCANVLVAWLNGYLCFANKLDGCSQAIFSDEMKWNSVSEKKASQHVIEVTLSQKQNKKLMPTKFPIFTTCPPIPHSMIYKY